LLPNSRKRGVEVVGFLRKPRRSSRRRRCSTFSGRRSGRAMRVTSSRRPHMAYRPVALWPAAKERRSASVRRGSPMSQSMVRKSAAVMMCPAEIEPPGWPDWAKLKRTAVRVR
jgi:hypothetical protein